MTESGGGRVRVLAHLMHIKLPAACVLLAGPQPRVLHEIQGGPKRLPPSLFNPPRLARIQYLHLAWQQGIWQRHECTPQHTQTAVGAFTPATLMPSRGGTAHNS